MIRVQVWDADYVNPQGVKTGGWEEVLKRFDLNNDDTEFLTLIVDGLASRFHGDVYRAMKDNEVLVMPHTYAKVKEIVKDVFYIKG